MLERILPEWSSHSYICPMKKYGLVIFDCDGTLVDSEPVSNQVVADMMNALGIEMTKEKSIELFAGTQFSFIHQYVIDRVDLADDFNFEKEFRRQSKVAFEKHLNPVPGVRTFIESLTIPYCVASNGPKEKMTVTLKVTGLDKYFEEQKIFSAYDINSWKPDPGLFLHAADSMGFKPEETIVIEDTISGVMAANNAGIDCMVHRDNIDDTFKGLDYKTFDDFSKLVLNGIE